MRRIFYCCQTLHCQRSGMGHSVLVQIRRLTRPRYVILFFSSPPPNNLASPKSTMDSSYLQPSESVQMSRNSSNASLKRQLSNNNGFQPHDPFLGLDTWDREENLIQLSTPSLSVHEPACGAGGHWTSQKHLSTGYCELVATIYSGQHD